MVPGPPMSDQLCGATVRVISWISDSSRVLRAACRLSLTPATLLAALANGPLGAPWLMLPPLGTPAGAPFWRLNWPATGVGTLLTGWLLLIAGMTPRVGLRTSPQFSMGMTRAAT